jgi:hypothetical protein
MNGREVFNIWNFVAYQLTWLAVLISAAQDHAWVGASLAIVVAAVHVRLRREGLELKLIGLAALIGMLVDSTLAMTGQIRFASAWPPNLAPYWMLSLWIVFATTLNHSLRWLMMRPVAAALAGGVGGPLAYLAGAKLGALSITTPAVTLPLIALLWMIALIALAMIVLRAATLPATARLA